MLPRVPRLLRQRGALAPRSKSASTAFAPVFPSVSARGAASSAQRIERGAATPELDGSFAELLVERDMGMGMGSRGEGRIVVPGRKPQELELADLPPAQEGVTLDLSELEQLGLVIDKPPQKTADEEHEEEMFREEKRSPAAILGSKRIGTVTLPEEMKDAIQWQVSQHGNPRDLRNSYLALPKGPNANGTKTQGQEKSTKVFKTFETELAKTAAILPGEYGAVRNVMGELEQRLGRNWREQAGNGQVVEFAGGHGAGVWATLDSAGALESSRRDWQTAPENLDIQFVQASRYGLEIVETIVNQVVNGTDEEQPIANVQYNRQYIPTAEPPSLVLSTFQLASFALPKIRNEHLKSLLALNSPYIVLIERSSREGWAAISEARTFLLEQSTSDDPLHVVAPCPHDGHCPMVGKKEPCSFSQRIERPSFVRRTKHSKRNEEEKGYCYLIIGRGDRPVISAGIFGLSERETDMLQAGRVGRVGREAAEVALLKAQGQTILREVEGHEAILETFQEPVKGSADHIERGNQVLPEDREEMEDSLRMEAYGWPRLVAPPLKRKGHVTMDVCAAEGHIQRVVHSKSHGKQAYYDARKTSWGDIFPHPTRGTPVIRHRGVRRMITEYSRDDPELMDEIIAAHREEVAERRARALATGTVEEDWIMFDPKSVDPSLGMDLDRDWGPEDAEELKAKDITISWKLEDMVPREERGKRLRALKQKKEKADKGEMGDIRVKGAAREKKRERIGERVKRAKKEKEAKSKGDKGSSGGTGEPKEAGSEHPRSQEDDPDDEVIRLFESQNWAEPSSRKGSSLFDFDKPFKAEKAGSFDFEWPYTPDNPGPGPFGTGQRREYSTSTRARPMLSSPRLPAISPSQTRSMSARPAPPLRPKTTLSSLLSLAGTGTPITCLTAYDYPTALLSESSSVDMTLVGDSLSQVALGYTSTTSITLDEMIHHAKAVVRGAKTPFVFADMPFGSFESSVEDGVRNAVRMIKEGGVDGIKIEGGREIIPLVKRLSDIGIPVMPHIGLQPQRATSLSGYLVQGRTAQSAYNTLNTARELTEAGAFAFLLEAMPTNVARKITEEVGKKGVFTIGIGAGKHTSGQVLVVTDVLGVYSEDSVEGVDEAAPPPEQDVPAPAAVIKKPAHAPRFVRQFGSVGQEMRRAVRAYLDAVRDGSFPDAKESYGMKKDEWEGFLALLEKEKSE
ncbi:3-methyl-2-oxobutanoate hydroxymethyltransferase [Cryptococcus sp. DSM 104549]